MGSPLLWGPGTSTNLQPGIQLTSTGSTVISGSINPNSVATAGLPGSLYLNTTSAAIFIKQDSGTTTNWTQGISSATPLVAYTIATNVAVGASSVIPWDTVVSDTGGLFTSSTTFTCPVAGVYLCGVAVITTASSNVYLVRNGNPYTYLTTGSSATVNSGVVPILCAKNDTLQFFAQSPATYNGSTAPAACSMFIMLQPQTSGSGSTGIVRSVSAISSPTTAGATATTDYVYLVSGTTTLTLPTAVGNTNLYTVKNTGVATVSIATTSAQTIDGSASPITLPVANTSLSLISDNANWRIV